MKKSCFAFFLLFIPSLYALPVGNPSHASLFYDEACDCRNLFNLGIGFYGDYVFNRHMETVEHKDINTTKLFTNAGYLELSYCERMALFATFGVSRLSLNTSLTAFNRIDIHPLFEIESGSHFSYSAGARATLYQFKCFFLGIEGQYFATTPNIKRMYIASGAVSYPDDVLSTRYSEWQVGTGLSYRFNEYFVPYAAVKYAKSFWKLDNGQRFVIETNTNTFLFNLKNQKHWGFAVGLSLSPRVCRKLAVTVEGRFFDEKALYVNGTLLF